MQGPQSMRGIFNDLASIRQDRANARKRFVVVRCKKDGTPRKVTAEDIRWTGTETREEATAKQAERARLNPGKQFVVVAL